MYRVSLANATAKRTCLPLYEFHQATPVATFLDPDEAGDVYSGMVVTRTGPDEVSLCDGNTTQVPWGLAALDKNPVIDDLEGMDLRLFAVWQGGPDAYFTINAPAFDTAASAGFTVPTDGTRVALWAGTSAAKGKLTSDNPGASAFPAAELVEVVSSTRIVIRLFAPPAFPAA